MMFYFKNEKELTEILKSFSAPELIYKGKLDAGPDEELYYFEDEEKICMVFGRAIIWTN